MTQAVESALERILLTEPAAGTKAMPSDIVSCTAEYIAGQGWIGNLGVLSSKSVLDSLPTNALVMGKVWAVVASADSVAKWNYMSTGWVVESSVGTSGASNLPGSPSNPFPDAAARDAWAAANPGELLSGGRTKRWTGNPPVEQVWVGPGAGNWIRADITSRCGIVALGDSITARAQNGGWFDYAVFGSNGAIRCLANLAAGGYQLSQMLNSLDNALLYNPAEIWIEGGTNVPPGLVTVPDQVASAISTMKEIIKKCRSARVALRVFGLPTGTGKVGYVTSLNQALYALCVSSGVRFTMLWDFVADANNIPISAYFNEPPGSETHPTKAASLVAAQKIIAEYSGTAAYNRVPKVTSAPYFGKVSDPLFASGTGVVAAAWSTTADGTNNVSARVAADTSGYKQTLTRSTANLLDPQTSMALSALIPGKTYDILFRVNISTPTTLHCKIFLDWRTGASAAISEEIIMYHSCTFTGIVEARFTMPSLASAANSKLIFSIIGSTGKGDIGVLEWETLQIIDVAEVGAA